MKVNWCIFDAMVREFVLDSLHNVTLDVEFIVIRETINFVDKDFDVDVWVGGLQVEYCAVEAGDGFEVVILRIDDPDQCAYFTKDGIEVEGGIHEVQLAREVPDLKVHEGTT